MTGTFDIKLNGKTYTLQNGMAAVIGSLRERDTLWLQGHTSVEITRCPKIADAEGGAAWEFEGVSVIAPYNLEEKEKKGIDIKPVSLILNIDDEAKVVDTPRDLSFHMNIGPGETLSIGGDEYMVNYRTWLVFTNPSTHYAIGSVSLLATKIG